MTDPSQSIAAALKASQEALAQAAALPATLASALIQVREVTADVVARVQSGLEASISQLTGLPDAIAAALADADRASTARLSALLSDLGIVYIALPGDGVTDITDIINGSLKPYTLHLVSPGRHVVDALKSVNLLPGARLSIAGSDLLAQTNASPRYAVVKMNVPDAELIGGRVLGDRATHIDDPNSTDEWGFGALVSKGALHCKITGTYFADCNGDGAKVGEGASGTVLSKIISRNNRRQALSICGASNTTVLDSTFADTNGTSPQAGIDLEPNAGEETLDTRIERCTITGNGYGINVQSNRVKRAQFIDCTIADNRSRGAMVKGLEIDFTGGLIARNGDIGLAYGDGSSGKIAGLVLERNVVAKHTGLRATPLAIKALPLPAGTANDLVINPGAQVDLSGGATLR